MVVTPSTVERERLAFPPTAQQPRNSATELITTSLLLTIIAGKGDIPEVLDLLKWFDTHFSCHFSSELGKSWRGLETGPLASAA